MMCHEESVFVTSVKVILVDDSAPVRKRLRTLLSACTQVEIIGEAETPPTALRLIKSLRPDVVILDVVLKGGSGYEVLAKIKKREDQPIVIMLTNYSTLPFRKKAGEEGADYFFDKSTEFDKVIEILKHKAA